MCQAIEYFYSNSLIHRDIKTQNILLDHDFIPYLSDFDTIKNIGEGDIKSNSEIDKTMTYDLGSTMFASPEQLNGDLVSYPTDIYSFGKVINKLYEALNNKSQNKIFINDGLSKICNYLYNSCVKNVQKERLEIADIKIIIQKYIYSFEFPYLYEIYLLNKMNAINFTLECLFLNEEDFEFSSEALQNFITFYSFLSNNKSESIQANLIGNFFYDNNDYLNALKYYKMSADMGNSDGQVNYGILHYYGQGVKQNYSEAKKYFELAADQKNVSAYNYLGNLYENGNGVQINYNIAGKYYKLSADQNDQHGLISYGNLCYHGLIEVKDILKAKYYYELAAEQNNKNANYFLGFLYYTDFGDYRKAINYLEIASQENSYASKLLGKIYLHGQEIQQDYMKAKHYYELSASMNNSGALVKLGKMYFRGKGVEKNLLKAREYYEMAIKYNNPNALYYLSQLYSTEDSVGIDISKSMNYLLECIQIHFEKRNLYQQSTKNFFCYSICNKYHYHSNNDLGLIYLIEFQDFEKAENYIRKGAYGEYPFGQSNLGLLLFFSNKYQEAEYMFLRASKHNFAIAEYNLGYLYEINNKREESIQMYIKASIDEDEPFIFHGKHYEDKRLSISKSFIICFTNLKLAFYYLAESDFENSKRYFIKSFSKFNLNEKSPNNMNEIFTYFEDFIYELPLFKKITKQILEMNKDQEKIDLPIHYLDSFDKDNLYLKEKESFIPHSKNNLIMSEKTIYNNDDNKTRDNDKKDSCGKDHIFDDLEQLFEFAKSNHREVFIETIQTILHKIEKVLYTLLIRFYLDE